MLIGRETLMIGNLRQDMFQIGGGAVNWKSKKQMCVALSIAVAE